MAEREIGAGGRARDRDDPSRGKRIDGRGRSATKGGADDPDEARTLNEQASGRDRDIGFNAAIILADQVDGVSVDLVAVEFLPAEDAANGEVGRLVTEGAGERARIAQDDGLAGGNDDRRLGGSG